MSVINRRQATALVKRADRICGEAEFRALLAEVWTAGYEQAGAIEHPGVNPFLPDTRPRGIPEPDRYDAAGNKLSPT